MFLVPFLMVACAAEPEEMETAQPEVPLNPNGDSELALLMRAMYDDAMLVKEQVEAGETPTISVNPQPILTATPSDPESTASPQYKSFARAYIHSVNQLGGATEDVEALYTGMVNTCMSCHTAVCPGPRVRIKKLYLD